MTFEQAFDLFQVGFALKLLGGVLVIALAGAGVWYALRRGLRW